MAGVGVEVLQMVICQSFGVKTITGTRLVGHTSTTCLQQMLSGLLNVSVTNISGGFSSTVYITLL